ncbi:MAG: hypothetical protein CMO81_08735 [Waddliaceae bacterium]|nr:hypothetical protein [Waddliaceae bacterium]
MGKGIFLGILAMAFFGLAFVMPLFTPSFSAIEIAIGRYTVYGLISLFILLSSSFKETKAVFLQHWQFATALVLSGYIAYYFLIVLGMRYAGASLGTLVNGGLLPIAASIYANLRSKDFSMLSLLPSLCLVFFGLGVVHWEDIRSASIEELANSYFGIGLVVVAVCGWAWFSVQNSFFLKQHRHVSPSVWSCVLGLVCLLICIGISIAALLWNPESLRILDLDTSTHELKMFLFTSLVLGLGGSWITTFLWNKASTLIPMSVLGQFIALEGVFGLTYILLFNQEFPSIFQIIGVSCILAGLSLSFQLKPQKEALV